MELARRGFAAALRGDLDTVGALLAPDVRWHGGDPASPGACRNRVEALAFMRRSDAIRGRRVELVGVVDAADDRVVVIMRPPSGGAEPAPPVANVTTFRDGKVVEIVHYADAGDALAAVGAARP